MDTNEPHQIRANAEYCEKASGKPLSMRVMEAIMAGHDEVASVSPEKKARAAIHADYVMRFRETTDASGEEKLSYFIGLMLGGAKAPMSQMLDCIKPELHLAFLAGMRDAYFAEKLRDEISTGTGTDRLGSKARQCISETLRYEQNGTALQKNAMDVGSFAGKALGSGMQSALQKIRPEFPAAFLASLKESYTSEKGRPGPQTLETRMRKSDAIYAKYDKDAWCQLFVYAGSVLGTAYAAMNRS